MKNYNFYKTKETNLNKAIAKVQIMLKDFSEGKRTDVENWNKCHDLEDRLTDRLKDNYFESQEGNFINNGIAIYKI